VRNRAATVKLPKTLLLKKYITQYYIQRCLYTPPNIFIIAGAYIITSKLLFNFVRCFHANIINNNMYTVASIILLL